MSPPSCSDGLLLEEFPSCRSSHRRFSNGDSSTVLNDVDEYGEESQGSSFGLLLEDFPPRRGTHERCANGPSSTAGDDADDNHPEREGGEAGGDGKCDRRHVNLNFADSNHVNTTNPLELSERLCAPRRSPLEIFRKIRSTIQQHYSARTSLGESSQSPSLRQNNNYDRNATASKQAVLAAGPNEASDDFKELKQRMRSTGQLSTAGAHRAIMLQSGGGISTTPPRSPVRDPPSREFLGIPASLNTMFPLSTRDTEPCLSTNCLHLQVAVTTIKLSRETHPLIMRHQLLSVSCTYL
ncbi:hypothetical protein MHU86_16950 [Fragilaria crotonensis]|nr:hypothetical protein MHU86_16950 [Fragilaria crotonensis]